MLGDPRVEGAAYFGVAQEPRERLRGDALSSELPPDPVADFSFAVLLEAHHVAGHVPVDEDGPSGYALVGQDLGPVRHERVPVFRREAIHAVRGLVPLMLEEYGKVPLRHVTQQYAARSSARSVPGRVTSSCARPYDLIEAVPGKHPTFRTGVPKPYSQGYLERPFGKARQWADDVRSDAWENPTRPFYLTPNGVP